jgi:hypothetical protein
MIFFNINDLRNIAAWFIVAGIILSVHAFGFLIIGSFMIRKIYKSSSQVHKGQEIKPVLLRVIIFLCALVVF